MCNRNIIIEKLIPAQVGPEEPLLHLHLQVVPIIDFVPPLAHV